MTTAKQSQLGQVAEALLATLISPNECDSNFESANVVDGLFAIARALHHCARALEGLGLKDAATPMGALEVVALEVKTGFAGLAQAVDALADRAEFTDSD